MNDPLKDFVERHREDFDDLDAPEFNLQLLKQRLGTVTKKKKPFYLEHAKWMVAASLFLIIASSVLLFRLTLTDAPVKQNLVVKNENDTAKPVSEKMPKTDHAPLTAQIKNVTKGQKILHRPDAIKPSAYYFEEKLGDSSSASNRLAAILAIDKSGLISEHTINQLAKTLEYDGNSNVRLAALGVMQKYKDDAHVSSLLVSALKDQQDPMVQLALVNLLGTMNNVKIEESLYALVNNPETFSAVKDEAYHILLNENK